MQRINQSGAGAVGSIKAAHVVNNDVASEIKKAHVVNKAETKEEAPSFPFTTVLVISSMVVSVLLGIGYLRKKKKKFDKTT